MAQEEDKVLNSKGQEYTQGCDDRLKNFKTIAAETGADPILVWYIYFKKHVDAIASYVKHGEAKSEEGIEGRILDVRNYCVLGRALIQEKNELDLDNL